MTDYKPEFLQRMAKRANANMVRYFKKEIPKLLRAHHRDSPSLSQEFAMTADAHAYMNGGFINRIGGLYSEEERAFILDISARFERVKLGFAYFSLLHSNSRPLESLRLAKFQLRTGWQKTGVPLGFNQTLADHHAGVYRLTFLLFFDDPEIELIGQTARYHDSGEPLIGDFTPYCPITRSEKARIEALGLRLITASRTRGINFLAQWMYDAVTLYDGNDAENEPVRSKVRDCDLLEMCGEALYLMVHCPPEKARRLNNKLQEFWEYVGPRLTNDRAKHFFESLSTSRYRTELTDGDFKNIMQHAHNYMLITDPNCVEVSRLFRQSALERMRKEQGFAQEARQPA